MSARPAHRVTQADLKALIAHLDQALVCAAALDRALDRDFDLDLVLDTGHARDLARARDLAKDLAAIIGEAMSLDRALAVEHDVALVKARKLLGHGRDLARVLEGVRVRDRELILARNAVKKLVDRVEDKRRRVADAEAKLLSRPENARRPRTRPDVETAPAAIRVVAWAVRILPPEDQARYDEEFRSELRDLAATGAARRTQFGHAVRLLTRAVQLRGEVKKARSQRVVS